MSGTHLRENTAVKTRPNRKRILLLAIPAALLLLLAAAAVWFLTRPKAEATSTATPEPTTQAVETPSPVTPADPDTAGLNPETASSALAETVARSVRRRDGFPLLSWDPERFYTGADGRIYYDGEAVETRTGIDVSEHQYDIDWAQVAAAGIDFAMIRLGYRGSTEGGLYEDPFYRQNMEGALSNGVGVGVYFYSQAVSEEEALEEADFVLSRLEGYEISYPVVYDWEIVGGAEARTYTVSRRTLDQCARAFCEKMEAQDYEAMIYFTQYLGYRKYILRNLTDYGFWYAEYEEKPNFAFDFDMWQYTCYGQVSGVTGEVDLNILFVR